MFICTCGIERRDRGADPRVAQFERELLQRARNEEQRTADRPGDKVGARKGRGTVVTVASFAEGVAGKGEEIQGGSPDKEADGIDRKGGQRPTRGLLDRERETPDHRDGGKDQRADRGILFRFVHGLCSFRF